MKKPTTLDPVTVPATNENHLNDVMAQTDAPPDGYAHLFADIEVTIKSKGGTTTDYIPFPKAPQRMLLTFVQQPPDSKQTHWRLTNAEYGLYIALRDWAAEYVVITADHEDLAKRTYTPLDEFETSWPQIANLFVVEGCNDGKGGTMFCPEVIPWLRKMRAKSYKCSKAGKAKATDD